MGLVRINNQSPDIAGGVLAGKDDLDVGAGDQGIMFGYASDVTEDCMRLTHSCRDAPRQELKAVHSFHGPPRAADPCANL